jgi:aspartate racemase
MQTKTIGLIGGIGWASTAEYYRRLNELTAERMDDTHGARIVLTSLNPHDFVTRAAEADTAAIERYLIEEGARLKAAGADFFMICANGAHRFAHLVVPRIDLPFISIVEETAKRIEASGIRTVGLLGVRQTMAGRFYHDRLAASGITVLTPSSVDQDAIHDIIYAELIHNRITERSREILIGIIAKLAQGGAGAVILGCTELPLIIQAADVSIPVFNTTEIHCEAAMALAFSAL